MNFRSVLSKGKIKIRIFFNKYLFIYLFFLKREVIRRSRECSSPNKGRSGFQNTRRGTSQQSLCSLNTTRSEFETGFLIPDQLLREKQPTNVYESRILYIRGVLPAPTVVHVNPGRSYFGVWQHIIYSLIKLSQIQMY